MAASFVQGGLPPPAVRTSLTVSSLPPQFSWESAPCVQLHLLSEDLRGPSVPGWRQPRTPPSLLRDPQSLAARRWGRGLGSPDSRFGSVSPRFDSAVCEGSTVLSVAWLFILSFTHLTGVFGRPTVCRVACWAQSLC